MSYITLADAKANAGINTANLSDAQIQVLIDRTTQIVNTYLKQSLEFQTYTVNNIPASPTVQMGFHIQLPNGWIKDVNSLVLNYGYKRPQYVLGSGDFYINSKLGFIETYYGQGFFTTASFEARALGIEQAVDWYDANVVYTAGFQTIPSDFLQAFYETMNRVKPTMFSSFASGMTGNDVGLVPASNRIQRYRVLTEQMEFYEDPVTDSIGTKVLTDWVSQVFDNYAFKADKFGIARGW